MKTFGTLFVLIFFVVYSGASAKEIESKCPNDLSAFSSNCVCSQSQEVTTSIRCDEVSNLQQLFDSLAGNDEIKIIEILSCNSTVSSISIPSLNATKIVIRNCGLEEFPTLGNLPNLLSLDLSDNQMANVPNKAFRGAQNLLSIRLSNNKICEIREQVHFIFGPHTDLTFPENLRVLDLHGNCFTKMPFLQLMNLTDLNLSHNKIDGIFFTGFGLSMYPNVQALDLSFNQISLFETSFIDETILETSLSLPQYSLTTLKMGNNKLEYIPSYLLEQLENLEMMDFSGNEIVDIPSFKWLKKLKDVNFDNNKIESIPTSIFAENSTLKTISFFNNAISNIAPGAFAGLDQLSTLKLANNSLTSLYDGIFDGIPNLESLDLGNNQIEELSNSSLASLPNLKMLDFANNKISEILPGTFQNLKKLETLGLSQNKITKLAEGVFENGIQHLDFDGNKFFCDDKLEQVLNLLKSKKTKMSDSKCDAPEGLKGIFMKDVMDGIMVNLPGRGVLDVKNVPIGRLIYVLRGGRLPRVPQKELEKVAKKLCKKVYDAAVRGIARTPIPGDEKYLPALESIPKDVKELMFQPDAIPYLGEKELAAIRKYYGIVKSDIESEIGLKN